MYQALTSSHSADRKIYAKVAILRSRRTYKRLSARFSHGTSVRRILDRKWLEEANGVENKASSAGRRALSGQS
jgi:hypothetical protein